ncbi:hypothetical protein [Deinococcus multiflagellatus]|uniref:Uncharacterized protein n=1 Tax=Deinococcus multiflagellatus TaxID=1656887 RepID=A0ABW1ZQV3_9DEIO|nr:hypothetical protein [Deinococcus multiflagellatus]MBZ9715392.1 hypothetical protein [Deinococcus multiflagellatus]
MPRTAEHLKPHQVATTEEARALAARRKGGPRGAGRRPRVMGQPEDWARIDAHMAGKSTQQQSRELMRLLLAGLDAVQEHR